MVSELLGEIRDQVGCLHKLAELVSVLDMLVSFASLCTISNYGESVSISNCSITVCTGNAYIINIELFLRVFDLGIQHVTPSFHPQPLFLHQ